MSKIGLDTPSIFAEDTLSGPGTCEPQEPWRYVDMHCHIDRTANAIEVAEHARTRGIGMLCTTVAPQQVDTAKTLFSAYPNIRVAAGMHPWWVAEGDEGSKQALLAAEQAAASAYVGEIGLDFSPAHLNTRDAQLHAFERIIAACAAHPRENRVVSIHAVRASSIVLDILERHELSAHATCIFHWFSGSSGDLTRLRQLGCHISVNERMLTTRRGREFARQMPLDRLHLETDAPPHLDTPYSAGEIELALERTATELARLRGIAPEKLVAQTTEVGRELLGI